MKIRPLLSLLDQSDPAWPLVSSWIAKSKNPVEVLPASPADREMALLATQVSTHSTLGAVVYETGGMLIDKGWIRLLGSGHDRLRRDLPRWNSQRTGYTAGRPAPYLIVGDDVLGGVFAINGGALGSGPGTVYYFAPNSLRWESMDMGYSSWLHWSLLADLERFYSGLRWPSWSEEVDGAGGDTGFSVYPPLVFAGPPVGERSRRPVPIGELYDLNAELARQLGEESNL